MHVPAITDTLERAHTCLHTNTFVYPQQGSATESRAPHNPLAAMLMGVTGKGGGAGAQRHHQQRSTEVDLRSRVAGMLDKERE